MSVSILQHLQHHQKLQRNNIVGLTTLTGGIILDDSISHIGDADTKIRFPAADTFTVETAGSERLRITSAGNIGINRTEPDQRLNVSGHIEVNAYDNENGQGGTNPDKG